MGRSRLQLKGKKFGKLLVLEYVGSNKRNESVWKCQCECGTIKNIVGVNLTNKFTKSCGCFRKLFLNRLVIKKKQGEVGLNQLFHRYRLRSKEKNLQFNLTKEEIAYLTKQNCYYCGCKPYAEIRFYSKKCSKKSKEWNKYVYNGIDRIDNNKGYIINNCVPCCKDCNSMKMEMNCNDFIKHIKKIIKRLEYMNIYMM